MDDLNQNTELQRQVLEAARRLEATTTQTEISNAYKRLSKNVRKITATELNAAIVVNDILNEDYETNR